MMTLNGSKIAPLNVQTEYIVGAQVNIFLGEAQMDPEFVAYEVILKYHWLVIYMKVSLNHTGPGGVSSGSSLDRNTAITAGRTENYHRNLLHVWHFDLYHRNQPNVGKYIT